MSTQSKRATLDALAAQLVELEATKKAATDATAGARVDRMIASTRKHMSALKGTTGARKAPAAETLPLTLDHLVRSKGFTRNFAIEEKAGRAGKPWVDPNLMSALKDTLVPYALKGVDHMNVQREKARRPRGKGEDGRGTLELIAAVAKGHPPETTPQELVPHIHSAMEENGMKAISDKHIKALVRECRRGN